MLALALLVTPGALAQAPALPPLVQGKPETIYSDAQRQKDDNTARDFVRTYLDGYPLEEQFALWRVKVCPRVWGMLPLASWTIEHRIKQVAQQVGAPVDWADPCKVPNVLVIVSPDPQATLDSLADRVPILVAMQDIMRLDAKYPIQSWYVPMINDYDGKKIIATQTDDGTAPFVHADGKRLENGLKAGLGMATVIINSKAVTGVSLAAVADYAAMAGLSDTVQRGYCQPVPTIANLMVEGCAPENQSNGLSEIDLAMLTGLYHSDDGPGLLQRQRIVRVMRDIREGKWRP